MAIKLGELLVSSGLISNAELEEALKTQVIFGSRLGTNLIEMGRIEENDLAKALSTKLGVPYVHPDELMNVPTEVIQLIPKGLAQRYKVIPLNADKNRLTLVMADPSDLPALDEISFITGFLVKPVVAPEIRLAVALEKYYNIKREQRYIALASENSRHREKKVAEPSTSKAEEAPPNDNFFAPGPEHLDFADSPEYFGAPDETEMLQQLQTNEEAPIAEAIQQYSVDSLSQGLADARNRDEIAEQLVSFLGKQFDQCALFLIRDETAFGWQASAGSLPVKNFGNLQIPLDAPSILKLVTDSKSCYRGPVPETPSNTIIARSLGKPLPGLAHLVPLIMMGRVVCVLYIAEDEIGNSEQEIMPELQKLISKAAMAFEILILRNKILMT